MINSEEKINSLGLVGDGLVDISTLSHAVGMSEPAIRVAMHRGQFPLMPMRIGRRLRWRLSDVRAFLASGDKGGAH